MGRKGQWRSAVSADAGFATPHGLISRRLYAAGLIYTFFWNFREKIMLRDYQPLPFLPLPPGTGYAQPTQTALDRVNLDSPGSDVMTDLTRITAVIVLAGDTVDEAHRRMIQRGVRLLLVVDQDRKVMGVITANDVSGEKPVQIAVQQGLHRDEVLVRNVMTPSRTFRCWTWTRFGQQKSGT
jgi:hypothetical protein